MFLLFMVMMGTKNEVARFITDMGYNPIILHEQPNRGKTIIEKIETFSNVCYAIILYTPCDKGASRNNQDLLPRARQNVVFEHGYLIGKLGRERVCALIKRRGRKTWGMLMESSMLHMMIEAHGKRYCQRVQYIRNAF